MSTQEAKRQRIADLLLVGVEIRRIAETVGGSMSTVYNVKGRILDGEGSKRKQGSGGVKFCKDNFADFWPANFWPSSCPDLNPLDYAIWGKLEHSTNRTSHPSVDHLKQVLIVEWDNMSEDFILNNCNAFRRRVQAVMDNEGGHIE